MLLLHGLGASSTAWHRQQTELHGGHRVLALDLPGFGGTSAPPRRLLSGDWYADCIAAFIEQVAGEPVHLVGHSMAGGLALLVSLKRPDLTRSLVLVSAAGMGPEMSRTLRLLCLPAVEAVLAAVVPRLFRRLGPARVERHLRRSLGGVEEAVAGPILREACQAYRDADAVRSILRALRIGAGIRGQRRRYYLLPRLSELRVPALLVWGLEDDVFPVRQAHRARAACPALRLEILPCGHSPHIEAPAGFGRVLADFLAGRPRATAA